MASCPLARYVLELKSEPGVSLPPASKLTELTGYGPDSTKALEFQLIRKHSE